MTEKIFTLDELKNYDGKEGRKAYIAVDGVVYDVTNVERCCLARWNSSWK